MPKGNIFRSSAPSRSSFSCSNLFGLFFFLQPPTGSLSTTVALALLSFAYFNAQGIRAHGLLGYLKHFMGPVIWLAPLFFVIEMIGNFARILSLSLRLFMNIFGEHTATGVFAGLAPILVPWPLMALGLFTALLQAFIFVTLSAVYIEAGNGPRGTLHDSAETAAPVQRENKEKCGC